MPEPDSKVEKQMHAADPIIEKAAKDALETVPEKPVQKHPLATKFIMVAAIVALVFGTLGAVLGALNTLQVNHQNKVVTHQNAELRAQQKCLISVVKVLTREQAQRANVAADDRNAVTALVHNIEIAKTHEDVRKAFVLYNKQVKQNNKRRAQHPIPVINSNLCDFKSVNTRTTSPIPGVSSVPASPKKHPKSRRTPQAKQSSTAHAGQQPFNTQPIRKGTQPKSRSLRQQSQQPQAPQPSPTPVAKPTRPASSPTPSAPPPSQTPPSSRQPLLPLPVVSKVCSPIPVLNVIC